MALLRQSVLYTACLISITVVTSFLVLSPHSSPLEPSVPSLPHHVFLYVDAVSEGPRLSSQGLRQPPKRGLRNIFSRFNNKVTDWWRRNTKASKTPKIRKRGRGYSVSRG
eukprot:GHVQ01034695.1.p2 GENE.GHVQ01034695.1~~GHVQ01034695.1.p2  ORF type:complete len:110 (+),score=6.35 GHVQ01034695.1:303-632(+)